MNRRQVLIGGGALALAGAGVVAIGVNGMGSMDAYRAAAEASRAALAQRPELDDLVRMATLAPNGHNTQPWLFQAVAEGMTIRPDLSRRTPVVDPDDHHVFVSLGCAGENLALAARAGGRQGLLGFEAGEGGFVAFVYGDGPAAEPVLVDAITKRQSTRADYDGRAVGAADLAVLANAASVPGVDVVFLTARPEIDRVRDLVVAGNEAQMADPVFMRELKSWLRFSPREAMERGDGLFSATTGNPVLPSWLGPPMFDWFVSVASETDKYAGHMNSSAGVAVFAGRKEDPEHWVLAGRACQRFALQATALGIKQAFVNQPVEVARFRADLAALAGLPGRRPDIVLRFGYGPSLPFSARRPVRAVMI
jgi:hypothetical protein